MSLENASAQLRFEKLSSTPFTFMYLSCQQQQQLLNLLCSDFAHHEFIDAYKKTHNLYATVQLSFLKVLTYVVFVEGEAMIDWENWEVL